MTKHFLYDILSRNESAVVICPDSSSSVKSAIVKYSVRPDLRILFWIETGSNENKGFQVNNAIALVISGEYEITILYTGVIKKMIKDYGLKTNPGILQNNSIATQERKIIYYDVDPKLIRYADFFLTPVQEKQ